MGPDLKRKNSAMSNTPNQPSEIIIPLLVTLTDVLPEPTSIMIVFHLP